MRQRDRLAHIGRGAYSCRVPLVSKHAIQGNLTARLIAHSTVIVLVCLVPDLVEHSSPFLSHPRSCGLHFFWPTRSRDVDRHLPLWSAETQSHAVPSRGQLDR